MFPTTVNWWKEGFFFWKEEKEGEKNLSGRSQAVATFAKINGFEEGRRRHLPHSKEQHYCLFVSAGGFFFFTLSAPSPPPPLFVARVASPKKGQTMF